MFLEEKCIISDFFTYMYNGGKSVMLSKEEKILKNMCLMDDTFMTVALDGNTEAGISFSFVSIGSHLIIVKEDAS